MIRKTVESFVVASVAWFAIVGAANAGPILGPTSAVIDIGGPGFGSIDNTFNQNGLSVGYTSGVTDFDTYLAGNPTHTTAFSCCEWFTEEDEESARVTYNLGGVQTIDALALWNEEGAGIGTLDLFTSVDNVTFVPLALGLKPFDNPASAVYPADVFGFAAVDAQYIRFDMFDCPQPNPGSFPGCGIGEVAFRGGEIDGVPEPATVALLGLGLAGFAFRRRKIH